jgi:predicted metal-dependent phosphotriesterase family hydrolase
MRRGIPCGTAAPAFAGRAYLYLFTHALPPLRKLGLSEAEVETMVRHNPRRMLIRVS